MAIRDVITMGYGNGTFSPGVNKIPTLGYAIAVPLVPIGMLVDAYGYYRSGAVAMDEYTGPARADVYTAGGKESDQ